MPAVGVHRKGLLLLWEVGRAKEKLSGEGGGAVVRERPLQCPFAFTPKDVSREWDCIAPQNHRYIYFSGSCSNRAVCLWCNNKISWLL